MSKKKSSPNKNKQHKPKDQSKPIESKPIEKPEIVKEGDIIIAPLKDDCMIDEIPFVQKITPKPFEELSDEERLKMPPAERYKHASIEKLDNFTIPSGKLKGKTFKEALDTKGYIDWIKKNQSKISDRGTLKLFFNYINRVEKAQSEEK